MKKRNNKIYGKIVELGMTQEIASAKIGVSISRFNAKLWGRNGAEWTRREMMQLKKLLKLSDKEFLAIFFSEAGPDHE